jgi:hypothetical protein
MIEAFITVLATAITVPDSGTTSLLLGTGVLSLGICARFLAKQKKK